MRVHTIETRPCFSRQTGRNPGGLVQRLILLFILGVFAGCARAPIQPRDKDVTAPTLIELQASLKQKDAKIAQLEELLNQHQIQLREKDAQIQSLKERLAQFGVF